MATRCVNLDWLEVHCFEPADEPHTADYFRGCGFVVHEREYGTRVYAEMFTLDGADGYPLLEVRRNPKSQGANGIHLSTECHLRLVNRTCYFDNAAQCMADFIERYGYTFNRISRVDICLDFERFDHGDDPQRFIERYMRHRYAKINQGNIHGHGADTWNGQEWNSLSWGAPTSDIGTKMYNKTLELYDPHTASYRKPYIREAWFRCGLIDDVHTCKRGDVVPTIWRIEFSVRSSVRKWFVIERDGKAKAYQSIRNTLDMYNSREKLLVIFASLSRHYFHFKYFEEGIRKDRCRDKVLFDWDNTQTVYKVGRDNTALGDGRQYIRPLDSLIAKIRLFQSTHTGAELHRACDVLIRAMEGESLRSDLNNPWSREELITLQQAMVEKQRRPREDVTVLMREIKALLHLNDNTAPF